ncbi:hypothetical protein BJ138DRAFT_1108102 [Hygrophoropsis aurantiaca]|uniref:Uncharacterized protein n=1 Tax=Hygrophoropsis aurantiaca TaxID=72124 RepID=A0ACB7ZPC4_9AGAM|nr:hypothetical protein BJ138DRAFT_1108102 [Hygrophoropsis aurantiaca]
MQYCCAPDHEDTVTLNEPSLLTPCGKVIYPSQVERQLILVIVIRPHMGQRSLARNALLVLGLLPYKKFIYHLLKLIPALEDDCQVDVFLGVIGIRLLTSQQNAVRQFKLSIGRMIDRDIAVSRYKAVRTASTNAASKNLSTQLRLTAGKKMFFDAEVQLQVVGAEYQSLRKRVSEAYRSMEDKRKCLELREEQLAVALARSVELADKAKPCVTPSVTYTPLFCLIDIYVFLLTETSATASILSQTGFAAAYSRLFPGCEEKEIVLQEQLVGNIAGDETQTVSGED